jgi:hypothetical protein
MLLWNAYRRNPLFLGLHESIDRYMKSVLRKQHAFEQFFLNKRLVRKPFLIPKISTVLQKLEGFTYATVLDLNMGYYTISLDPDGSKVCTIIFPWGKFSYKRLPMGIAGCPDIFQEKMSDLMATLEFVRTYLDDLLIITKGKRPLGKTQQNACPSHLIGWRVWSD